MLDNIRHCEDWKDEAIQSHSALKRGLPRRRSLSRTSIRGLLAMTASVFTLALASAPTALADCISPASPAGGLEYFTGDTEFKYCDGTNWVGWGEGGSGLWTDNTTYISYGSAHFINPGETTPAALSNAGTRMFYHADKGAFRGGIKNTGADYWGESSTGAYSISWGQDLRATNTGSAAFGIRNLASGSGALVVGLDNTAGGTGSIVSGQYNQATGLRSVAMGYFANATGQTTIALGSAVTSSGAGAVTIGGQVMAGSGTAGDGAGDRSMAFGLQSQAQTTDPKITGDRSAVFFFDEDTADVNSTYDVTGSDIFAIIGGTALIDPGRTEVDATSGLALDVHGNIGAPQFCDEDGNNCFTAASVGGGSSLWTAGGGDTIYYNSGTPLVGIGLTSPEFPLQIQSFSSVTLAQLMYRGASSSTKGGFILLGQDDGAALSSGDRIGGFLFRGSTDSGDGFGQGAGVVAYADGGWGTNDLPTRLSFEVAADGSGTRTEALVIKNTGNVGINQPSPSYTLDVDGDINYSGSLTNVSDVRLKENIAPLSDYVIPSKREGSQTVSGDPSVASRPQDDSIMDKLMAINTYTYTMKADEKHETRFGVMAQELEEVFPELVHTQDDGYKSVRYVELIPPMIEASKELRAENDMLRAELASVKNDVEALKRHTGFGISQAAIGFMVFGGWLMVFGFGYLRKRS